MAVDTACGRMTRVMVCVEVSPQYVCGFALHVGHRFQSAAHRLGHVGTTQESEADYRAGFGGPYYAEFGQAEVQKVQLYQQWRIAAEFDVDSHDLPGDRDTRDFHASADQTHRDGKQYAKHGYE